MSVAVDTNHLIKPTQRKLIATWRESSLSHATILPVVANELTHNNYEDDLNSAIARIQQRCRPMTARSDLRLAFTARCDQWWLQQFNNPQSIYQVRKMTPDEYATSFELLEVLPIEAFPKRRREDMLIDSDANIVSQAITTEQHLLVTSDTNTIKIHILNDWIVQHGHTYGIRPEETIFEHDLVFEKLFEENPKELLAIAIAASWPLEADASNNAIISNFEGHLLAMKGALLPRTADLLREEWDKRKDESGILKFVEANYLPRQTRAAELTHPAITEEAS